jgi:GMP synthase (glutamine-hydrolysing)
MLIVWITGDPVPPVRAKWAGFDAMYANVLDGVDGLRIESIDARADRLDRVPDGAGVLISGSPSSVTEIADHPWMQRLARTIVAEVARGTPLFGVCFGHQIMAHALGGEVTRNPAGFHMQSVQLAHVESVGPLAHLQANSWVNVSHEDHVHRVPPKARVIARALHDPHHALAYARHTLSTQFHPEFDREILRGYIDYRRTKLADAGHDVDSLLTGARDSFEGREVLRRWMIECVANV